MSDAVNPYDQVYSDLYNDAGAQEARLRDSMIKAQETHPDEAAKAIPMSEETGLPIDMVVRNLPEMQKSFNTPHLDYQSMLKDYPKLSNFLAQPDNAAVSHDDVPALQRVSSFFSSTNNFFEQAVPRAIKSAVSGASEGIGSTLTSLGALSSNAGDSVIDSLVNSKPSKQWTANGWVDTAPAGPVTNAVGATLAGALSTAGEGMAWLGKQYTDIAPQIMPDDPGIGNKVMQTVGQFLPWIAAATATGGETALPYLFGGSAVGAGEEQAKAEGKYGTAKANLAIALNGAVNALLGTKRIGTITHALPDGTLLKIVEGLNKIGVPVGSNTERWVTKALEAVYRGVVGGGQMAGITATHNATDKFLMDHPEKDLTEGVGEQFSLAGAASAILGTMFHVVAKTPTMFDAARANASKEYFKHSKDVLADNKLLKRAPEKLNALIDSQTGGHDIHVNSDAMATFYQSITPEERARLDAQMPDLKKDLADAAITKADLPINQADFHTYIQPLDQAGHLDDWAKLIPEHMSLGDIKAHDEFMQSLFDHVDAENQARATSADATDTQNSVYDQLIRFTGAGRTPSAMVDVAKLISENPAKFHEAMMKRTGNRADVGEVLNRLIRDVQIRRVLPDMETTTRKGDLDLQLDDLRNIGKDSEKKLARPPRRDKNGKLKPTRSRKARAPTPVMDYLGSLGGIRRGSPTAKEIESMGVDKNTHPQVFNKFTAPDENQGSMLGKVMHDAGKYGLRSIDGLVPSEFEDATGIFPKVEPVSGLVDETWLLDQIRNEAHADVSMSDKDQERESLSQILDYLGLDVNKHSNIEIKRAIEKAQADQKAALDGNEGTTFDQKKTGIDALAKDIIADYNKKDQRGIKFDVSEGNGVISVGRIFVPDRLREQGIGTDIMQRLMDYADKTGQRIALTPSSDFGGNLKRLQKFYKGLGFKPNKDKAIDHSVSETMIREPKEAKNPPSMARADWNKNFKKWSKGSPTIKIGDAHEFKADKGVVVEALHGTTADFHTFDRSKANPEADMGAGFYFTNNHEDVGENYAGLGPDLTQKIDLLAERIAGDTDRDYKDPAVIAEARAEFMSHEGATMPVYIRFDKPFVLGGAKETFLDMDQNYDEETEEYGEPTGKLVDFIQHLKDAADEHGDGGNVDDVIGKLHEAGMDGGLRASELMDILTKDEHLGYMNDQEGRLNSKEIVREALERTGFDGVIDQTVNKKFGTERNVGKQMAGMDEGTVHYIAFHPEQIKSRFNRGTFDPRDSNILYQGGVDKRGSITFTPEGTAVIHTFAQEDLSTVLHEFGHLYWKAMTEIGNLADAPASVVRDIKTMRDWVGAKEGEKLTVEQEEKIADGFLDYLRKGEAPSADMQGAFSRFKGWLVRLYTGVRDTLPKISPEVKDVFDRMFATDAEIEALKAIPEFQPDPAILAMLTKAERERYAAKMEKQIADAKDRLFREAMRQSERENTQLYKDQRAEIEKIATEQVSGERGYRTIHEAILAGGLSKKMLIKEFGKEVIPYLSGHGGIVKTDGVDPAMIATMMGYENSRAMIDDLMNLKPKKEAIRELTDGEMLRRHGDMLRDGTIEGEALKAYHNNLKAELIAIEMETAAKAAGIPAPSKEAIKARAIQMLAAMKVKDIIPYRHYQAELKAARAAGLAAGKKDYVGTARAKGQQLLNHHLYRMSLTAREEIDQQMTQWRKLLGRSDKNIGKALDTDYIYAARFILARHGLGKASYNFDAWMNHLKFESSQDNPNGDPEAYFAIRDIIEQERASDPTPYKMMSLSDFHGLGDVVNSLILTGRDRSKITIEGKKVELKDAITAITDVLANRKPSGISTGFSGKLTSIDRAKLFIMSANANWRRVEHWVQMIDSGNNGPVRKFLWAPVKKAVLAYRDERAPWMTRIMDLLAPERERLHGEKIPAPELQNEKTGETYTFSDLSELMGMMLHLGNESNRFKLLKGRGWSEEGMDAFMNRMYEEGTVTKHDLDLRQKLWDMMEELKPRLWSAHKEMYGYRPEEVSASPVTTPHGEYRGGYWPAIVDTEVSEDAQIRADVNAIANTGQSYAFPSAGRGALKSRVENYAGPLQMSMRLLPNHIDWALKFIHIEPAVKDAAKIVMNREFRDEMRKYDPQATTDMLVPWLQRTAKQITEIPSTGRFFKSTARIARWARTSAGIQALGGNFANMGIHLTQLAPFARELGANRMAEAMAAYIKNPGDIAEAQNELSPELRNRQQIGAINPMTEIGRILADQSDNELKRKIDKNAAVRKVKSVKDWSHDNAYILQAIVWHMTDHIGWHAAYNKALEGEVRGIDANDSNKAVEYADSLVRRVQGSHNPEDISNIEMRSAWAKIFQFMYGWFNNMGNYTATEKDIIKNSNKTPAAKAASSFYLHLMTMVAVGFGAEVISGTVRGATPSQNDKFKREGSVALHWLEELGISMARWEGAKVPYLNAVVNGIISKYTDKQYSDHLAPSPLFDQVDTILRTPGELWKAMHGQGTNATAIADLLSTMGFLTSTPLSALKKPVKYLMRVDENKEHPKNGLEFVRGVLGGPAPKK